MIDYFLIKNLLLYRALQKTKKKIDKFILLYIKGRMKLNLIETYNQLLPALT